MRKKDLALIVVIVFISAVVSLFASKAIFASPKNRQQQVEVVKPITADFPAPDTHYFNPQAFDPTKTITIGQNNNNNPFSGSNTQ
ncbi:MAG TPA: hypothetical protein VH234_02420 [Candidatus Saccharimonadales bacterium]|jgi:hypothetical protein|nr:hypothetical protein [Candidatus Saccharimonadales bacterium]